MNISRRFGHKLYIALSWSCTLIEYIQVNHKIGVIVAMVFSAFLLYTILIIAKALYRVFQK